MTDYALDAAIASAVAALASAIATGLAVWLAVQTERRSLFREVRAKAHTLSVEVANFNATTAQLNLEIDSFKALDEGGKGSDWNDVRAKLFAAVDATETMQKSSELLSATQVQAIRRLSADQLLDALATIEEQLVGLRAVREQYLDQLSTLRARNREYRERRSANVHQR